ncbi:hypothetical protein ACFLTW_04900 [Chloroflexota bacterium]
MAEQITLKRSNREIPLGPFTAGFLARTTLGMASALKGVGLIHQLEITIEESSVRLVVNGAEVPVNDFAGGIIRSTIIGMLAPLKEAAGGWPVYIGVRP